jgi:hypothetical protein
MSDDTPIFVEVIQRDPDICSNCFRRTHDRYERNYRLETYFNDEKGEWDVRPVDITGIEIEVNGETEVIGDMDDDVWRHPDSTLKIPEQGGHRGKVTICECGFRYSPILPDDECKNRPLDKSTFFDHADRLIARLHEAEVDLNTEVLYDELERRKSNPDNQFADDDIYAKAVQIANATAP